MRGLKDNSFVCDVTRVHRIPRGVRELKGSSRHRGGQESESHPKGMRGLKRDNISQTLIHRIPHPARDAWIEAYPTVKGILDIGIASLLGCMG